jgi:hypothetical protein
MIGRDTDGNIYTSEALAVAMQMEENAKRHTREKAPDELQPPPGL